MILISPNSQSMYSTVQFIKYLRYINWYSKLAFDKKSNVLPVLFNYQDSVFDFVTELFSLNVPPRFKIPKLMRKVLLRYKLLIKVNCCE